MVRIAGSVAKSWLAPRAGVVFDWSYYFDPTRRQEVDRRCNEYVREHLADLPIFYTESNLGRREFYQDDMVLVGGIQPNMIVGLLCGAEFIPTDTADADISASCLRDVGPAELPPMSALLGHELTRQLDTQIRQMRSTASTPSNVIPPFFWDASGRAAIHGSVTSGLKFYGDEFFLMMATEPRRCAAILRRLTEYSVALVEHFANVGHVRISGIHVGECVACMLDVDNFRRFVIPAASQVGHAFPPLRFHSCGRSDHLIAACREIENLAELDVGGETSVAEIRHHFGDQFPIGIAPLVADMRASSSAPILAWIRRVVRENAGGPLTIGFHLEQDYNLDTIRALHREIERCTD